MKVPYVTNAAYFKAFIGMILFLLKGWLVVLLPRALIILMFPCVNISFIWSGVAVVAKSRSAGLFPLNRSLNRERK